jgi:uncharacterized caspase-like protein
MRNVRTILIATLLILVTLTGLIRNGMAADRRVALVIGNSAYRSANLVLTNPKNDAEDVAAALRELDFEVVHAIDARKEDFDRALARFARLASGADVALFFYAGHALQFQGRNYLMPVDAELEDEVSLRYQMQSTDDVRAALERVAGIKIMILDACRNNPAADILRRKIYGESRALSQTRGLARIDRGQGIVVAFATAADEVAMDGRGRNSPYTTALLKRLREPGLEIEIMFRRIAADVNAQTSGQQRPETYVSLISEYYLNQKDRTAWDGIKSSEDPSVFRDYITRFPASVNTLEAQSRLRDLERATRERQLRAELAAREAERAREQETQRLRLAGLERERLERESAQRQAEERARAEATRKRDEEEQRVRAEAAKRLEDERAKVAAIEREREAARQAEQRARAEAAKKGAEEQRATVEAANKRREEEEQQRRASAERNRSDAETARRAQEAEGKRIAGLQPVEANDGVCQRDVERLTRLRAAPDADEVIRFERELACERLRQQVVRLRESVVPPGREVGVGETTPMSSATPDAQQTRTESREMNAGIRVQANQPVSNTSEDTCRSDGQKLARLRTTRSHEETIRFQRELTCEKLRPQLLRLLESMEAR